MGREEIAIVGQDSDLQERIRRILERGSGFSLVAQGSELPGDRAASVVHAIAAGLDRAGVAEGSTVAVLGRNTFACSLTLIAVALSGRCAGVVNPFSSPEAVMQGARNLEPQAIILPRDHPLVGLSKSDIPVLTVADDGSVEMQNAIAPQLPDVPRDGIVIFTSGTTGEPKQLHLALRSLSQAIEDIEEIHAGFGDGRGADGNWPALIQYTPLAHIGGVLTLLRAGAQARRLVLFEKFDPELWAENIERYSIATTGLPPSMLRMVLDSNIAPARISSLVSVWSGTAPLRPEDRVLFTERYGIPVLGNYGATEFCGAIASWSLEEFHRSFASKPDAVGRLNPSGATARTRSPEGDILPDGEVGALEFRVPRVGDHWISTNDLGRVDKDGFLTLHGRQDDAIIRGGFKLSPTKIAAVLREHPAVKDAAVVGVSHNRLGQVPAAAIQAEAGHALDASTLANFVRDRLPAYFVPTQFRIVDALPRNSAMKLDRRAIADLFAPDVSNRDSSEMIE